MESRARHDGYGVIDEIARRTFLDRRPGRGREGRGRPGGRPGGGDPPLSRLSAAIDSERGAAPRRERRTVQASCSTTAPSRSTAKMVGTTAMPYFSARPGLSRTSIRTRGTGAGSASSRRSHSRHSEQIGWVNWTIVAVGGRRSPSRSAWIDPIVVPRRDPAQAGVELVELATGAEAGDGGEQGERRDDRAEHGRRASPPRATSSPPRRSGRRSPSGWRAAAGAQSSSRPSPRRGWRISK